MTLVGSDIFLITEARVNYGRVVGLIRYHRVHGEALESFLRQYLVPRKLWNKDFLRFGTTIVRWDRLVP